MEAKRKDFDRESKDQLKLLNDLKTEGLVTEHDYHSQIRRTKMKAMKFEWDGFLSALHTTNRYLEDIIQKRRKLDNEIFEFMAELLDCPKETLHKILGSPALQKDATEMKTDEVEVEEETEEESEETESEETEESVEEEETEEGSTEEETEEESVEEETEEEMTDVISDSPAEEEEEVSAPTKRKPGRPKGAKNKDRVEEPTPVKKAVVKKVVEIVETPVVAAKKPTLTIKAEPKKAPKVETVVKPVAPKTKPASKDAAAALIASSLRMLAEGIEALFAE